MKTTTSELLRREWRVMFSGNRSPLALRILKWIVFLEIAHRLYRTRWFKVWVFGLPLAGVATHLLYRHGTQGWTRPWGGWNDVEAVELPDASSARTDAASEGQGWRYVSGALFLGIT